MPKKGTMGGGGADPNIMKLQEQNRIRLLDYSEAIEWFQHTVENADDAEQVQFVVCPSQHHPCPLCAKPTTPEGDQRFPKVKRFATNVWDYGSNSVKVLIGGQQIFGPKTGFDSFSKVGFDPEASDIVIHKSGKGRNTTYTVMRDNDSVFQHDVAGQLHDLSKYDTEPSEQQIFEILERAGYDYDALETQEFTLEEAEAFVMPYGKFGGMTVEQIYATEASYMEYIAKSKEDKGQIGDPVYIAFVKVLEANGLWDATPTTAQKAPPTPPPAEPVPPSANEVADEGAEPVVEPEPSKVTPVEGASQASLNMVTMVGPDDNEIAVPPTAQAGMEASGFKVKTEEPPPPPEPVKVTMTMGEQSVEVDEATATALETGGWTRAGGQTAPPPQAPAEDDKPFKCDECEWAGKTPGSLTQHKNKFHPAATEDAAPPAAQPTPAATPTAAPAAAGGPVLERVKTKLAGIPAGDYDAMLALFMKVAGKRAISEFSEEELARLEQELDNGALAS